MKEESEAILGNIVKHLMSDAIRKVDVESIIIEQMRETVKAITQEVFGKNGDFAKALETKLEDELKFNMKKLTVPDFGELAIATVVAEMKKVEHDEKERIAKEAKTKLNALLGTHKHPITLKELKNTFALSMWEEHLRETTGNNCNIEDEELPNDMDEVIEMMKGENPFELTFIERGFGTRTIFCITHLQLSFKYKEDEHFLEVHIAKKGVFPYDKDDFHKKNEKNLYSILSIKINGKDIRANGFIPLDMINEPTEEKLVSRVINGGLIDASDLSDFELDRNYE